MISKAISYRNDVQSFIASPVEQDQATVCINEYAPHKEAIGIVFLDSSQGRKGHVNVVFGIDSNIAGIA
jgi:hypothetical protein